MDYKVVSYFDKYFKWSIAAMSEMDGDMPVVKGSHTIPKCLVSFTDLKKDLWSGAFVHFFQNDYKFDGEHGIWLDTTRYIPLLERFMGILSPDFSLYTNAGRIPHMWNTYRNRLAQCHLERLGFDVIPTVSWSEPYTYDFCFNGLPAHSVVAVSTLGVMTSAERRRTFECGYAQMCKILEPEFVIIYGSDRNLTLGNTPHRCFSNRTYDWTDLLTKHGKVG